MRRGLILAVAIAATLFAAAPAAAAGNTTDYGSKLFCRYRSTAAEGPVLRRIVVSPPQMYSWDMKKPSQEVGWRFQVLRSIGTGPVVVIYKSSRERGIAYDDAPAAFSTMRFDVTGQQYAVEYYWVRLRLVWYSTDGSVQHQVLDQVATYRIWIDGEHAYNRSSCQGTLTPP